jgi:hypothetical protein
MASELELGTEFFVAGALPHALADGASAASNATNARVDSTPRT